MADLHGSDARTPSRSPRPAATTCCCAGRRAPARPAWPSGSRDPAPDLEPEEALELTAIHSLAGHPGPARRAARRPALRGAAPRRHARPACSAAARARSARASSAGPLRRALPRRVPALPRRRHRRPAPAAGDGEVTVARGDESVRLPARGMIVLACNPCPCGEYQPKARGEPLHLQRAPHGATTGARMSGPVADRIDIARHVEPGAPRTGSTRWRSASRRRSSGPGSPRPAPRQAARFAGRGWRLNAHVPGTALVEQWPLDGGGGGAARRRSWYAGG